MTNVGVGVIMCELLILWSRMNVSVHSNSHPTKGVQPEFHYLSKLICKLNHTTRHARSPTTQDCIGEYIQPMLNSCYEERRDELNELDESTPVPW